MIVAVWRLVELLWPGPVTSELVNRRSPEPRADDVVISFAGVPQGLKHGLIVTGRCRGLGGRALEPRLEFAGPIFVYTSGEGLANQPIVLAPV